MLFSSRKKYNIMKILITGASGFIGSFIVEEALSRGLEVWAAVRKSTNRKYLKVSISLNLTLGMWSS